MGDFVTMIDYKTGLIGLFICALTAVGVQACPNGNPNDLDYIRRENNRCEGILKHSPISGSLRLISFATRGINSFGDSLTIRIPRLPNTLIPNVTLRVIDSRYQLDDLHLVAHSETYDFHWSTDILKAAGISLKDLRAIASMGEQIIYIPVIIGTSTNQYEFVFYSSSPVRFQTFQIKYNGTIVHNSFTSSFEKGEIHFPWVIHNQLEGRYQIYYEAEIERIGRAPRLVRRTINFAHNPNWLR
jgi:hypothetical protein